MVSWSSFFHDWNWNILVEHWTSTNNKVTWRQASRPAATARHFGTLLPQRRTWKTKQKSTWRSPGAVQGQCCCQSKGYTCIYIYCIYIYYLNVYCIYIYIHIHCMRDTEWWCSMNLLYWLDFPSLIRVFFAYTLLASHGLFPSVIWWSVYQTLHAVQKCSLGYRYQALRFNSSFTMFCIVLLVRYLVFCSWLCPMQAAMQAGGQNIWCSCSFVLVATYFASGMIDSDAAYILLGGCSSRRCAVFLLVPSLDQKEGSAIDWQGLLYLKQSWKWKQFNFSKHEESAAFLEHVKHYNFQSYTISVYIRYPYHPRIFQAAFRGRLLCMFGILEAETLAVSGWDSW